MTTNKQQIKQLLIKSLLKYKFEDYITDDRIVRACNGVKGYNEKYAGSTFTDEDRIIFETGIKQAFSKKFDLKYFNSKSVKELYKACCYIENEYDNGCYTYDDGIYWYGVEEFNKAKEIMKEHELKDLRAILLNGRIYELLKRDFPSIKLLDIDDYKAYMEYNYENYDGIIFGKLGNYILQIGCTIYVSTTSMLSKIFASYKINDQFVFILKNYKTNKSIKVNNYSDIKRTLQRVKE